MRKTLLALAALFLMTASAALSSPHFIGSPKLVVSGTDVQVCWKEAGLGSNVNIDYVLSADASATYVCVNGGGNCPNAANKTTVAGPISTSGTFSSGKNGSISACLTLEAIGPGSFSCPGGQTVTLSDASFSNIVITDTTNGVSARSGAASVSVFTCPN